jgi:hypothetical protein
MPLKSATPVETQINSSSESEKEYVVLTALSSDGKAMPQMVTARPPIIQSSAPIKCSVNRWDLGKEDKAEYMSMGNMLIRMHTQNNVAFVTLAMATTGAIVVSDNIGPLTQPRWSQASGVLRVCLFNRLNQLGVYDLSFSDAKQGQLCHGFFRDGGSMWVRELVRKQLLRNLVEAYPVEEELLLPEVPQEAEQFMSYPIDFECAAVEAWNPADDHVEVKVLGTYANALLEVHGNGQEIALGPVAATIWLSGHSGHALSARLMLVSCLDPGRTELLNIDLVAENAVFVDTYASGDAMLVLQLPSRGMALTLYYESAEIHHEQECIQPSLFEWVDIWSYAQCQVSSGNAFVAQRRARVVELELLIEEAKVRYVLWLEEQAAIKIAKEKAPKAAAEATPLSREDISGILKGWINTLVPDTVYGFTEKPLIQEALLLQTLESISEISRRFEEISLLYDMTDEMLQEIFLPYAVKEQSTQDAQGYTCNVSLLPLSEAALLEQLLVKILESWKYNQMHGVKLGSTCIIQSIKLDQMEWTNASLSIKNDQTANWINHNEVSAVTLLGDMSHSTATVTLPEDMSHSIAAATLPRDVPDWSDMLDWSGADDTSEVSSSEDDNDDQYRETVRSLLERVENHLEDTAGAHSQTIFNEETLDSCVSRVDLVTDAIFGDLLEEVNLCSTLTTAQTAFNSE